MIHRRALAAKTLPLSSAMSGVIKLVNYIKRNPLNTRLFGELCKVLDSSSETLIFHAQIRWLSRGNESTVLDFVSPLCSRGHGHDGQHRKHHGGRRRRARHRPGDFQRSVWIGALYCSRFCDMDHM